MKQSETLQRGKQYLEEISTHRHFPFENARLTSKALEPGFDFTLNEIEGEPKALIYGEEAENRTKIGCSFQDQQYETIIKQKTK